ncbi:MAG: hypothetical protein E7586_01140 [Ruminococcaceae bacterium]|nr:hypothetical protein [Oscillospiraceae bacterium]
MKKTIALLITIFVSFSLCSCYKVTDWALKQITEAKRYELVIEFDCEKESDFEIIEKRLELFDFRIISKDESTYKLSCPFWITTDFWNILCSNSDIRFIDEEGNDVINSPDVLSSTCSFLELKFRISETLYNKCHEEFLNIEYYLTNGTDKYDVYWCPSQEKEGYFLQISLKDADLSTTHFSDEMKALFHYAMNITSSPLEGEVNFTVKD